MSSSDIFNDDEIERLNAELDNHALLVEKLERQDAEIERLRAKSASDSETLAAAQDRLGHQSSAVTARVYRRGVKVTPLR